MLKKIPFTIQLVAVMCVIAAAFFGFQAQVRSSSENNKVAAAASDTAFKMAVVDVQALLTDSQAAKSIQAQMQEQREKFQKDIAEKQKTLKEKEDALKKSRTKGNEAEFNKKREEFQKTLAESQAEIQKHRQSVDDAAGVAVGRLREEVTKIVAEIANKEKYDIVITRQNVILAVKTMDITPAVMEQLNANLQKIDLKVQSN